MKRIILPTTLVLASICSNVVNASERQTNLVANGVAAENDVVVEVTTTLDRKRDGTSDAATYSGVANLILGPSTAFTGTLKTMTVQLVKVSEKTSNFPEYQAVQPVMQDFKDGYVFTVRKVSDRFKITYNGYATINSDGYEKQPTKVPTQAHTEGAFSIKVSKEQQCATSVFNMGSLYSDTVTVCTKLLKL